MEFAPALLKFCSRRIARAPSDAVMQTLLTQGCVEADALGVDQSWPEGAFVVVPPDAGAPGIDGPTEGVFVGRRAAYVALLEGRMARLVVEKGVRLHFGALREHIRFAPGSSYRCGNDVRPRWVPASRRCAR
mmetsp:Transcript_81883/g.235270  ORF Transcript_81883/g.235270 Transcript_81883/m.235270 type:complete len:132 (-) Transcript_81883:26-421(-)